MLETDPFAIADPLGPARVIHVHEPSVGLNGTLLFDNVAAGPAIGGLRMAIDVSTEECARLARAMTLKNAAAGLPHGGAKSLLYGDPKIRPEVIHEGNASRLRTRLVVSGANIPMTAEAERFLHEHGVVCVRRSLPARSTSRELGNARELENCIERALALGDSHEIRASDILLSSNEGRPGDGSLQDTLVRMALERRVTLKELSDSYIDAALEAAHGRKAEAAKLLDVNRRTLYRREKRNGHAAREAEAE